MKEFANPRRSLGSRIGDFVAYATIAGAVGGLAFLIGQTDISHDSIVRWGGLFANTCLLFGYFVAESRRYFRRSAFWIVTAGLLAVHLCLFAIVLTLAAQWKLVWFLVMYLEAPFLNIARNRALAP